MKNEMQKAAIAEKLTAAWSEGTLHEISPFGTGYVEDKQTGRVYGFYRTMLVSGAPTSGLEGAKVRFHLDATGVVAAVQPITEA